MSGLLASNRDFISLLLNGERKQQRALMSTLTDRQTDCLSEIFHNIAHVLEISPDKNKRLKRRSKVINELAKVNRSRKYRKRAFQKHAKAALAIAESVKEDIYRNSGL